MLSRPHQATTSTAGQAQVAALFGTMGLFAGVLLVAAVAWLYTLTQQMHDQAEGLAKLGKSAELTEQVQKVALDAILTGTEERREPRKFLENYRKAQKDLEEANQRVKSQEKLTILAAADNQKLEKKLVELTEEKQVVDDKLKTEQERSETEHKRYREMKDERDAFYDTKEGQFAWKYSAALYAAIAGWIAALLATLGLLALWLSRTPLEGGNPLDMNSPSITIPGVSPNPAPPQEPPHQIV